MMGCPAAMAAQELWKSNILEPLGGKGGTSGTKEDYFGKPGDAGSGLSDSQETQLGAAGGGGGGIGWYGQSDFGTSSGLGGSGYTGGVVIETASV